MRGPGSAMLVVTRSHPGRLVVRGRSAFRRPTGDVSCREVKTVMLVLLGRLSLYTLRSACGGEVSFRETIEVVIHMLTRCVPWGFRLAAVPRPVATCVGQVWIDACAKHVSVGFGSMHVRNMCRPNVCAETYPNMW